VAIGGLAGDLRPLATVPCTITYGDGRVREIALRCRIDTEIEIDYVRHGGVLHYVLRDLAHAA
jgi:aconitate hydratase